MQELGGVGTSPKRMLDGEIYLNTSGTALIAAVDLCVCSSIFISGVGSALTIIG